MISHFSLTHAFIPITSHSCVILRLNVLFCEKKMHSCSVGECKSLFTFVSFYVTQYTFSLKACRSEFLTQVNYRNFKIEAKYRGRRVSLAWRTCLTLYDRGARSSLRARCPSQELFVPFTEKVRLWCFYFKRNITRTGYARKRP